MDELKNTNLAADEKLPREVRFALNAVSACDDRLGGYTDHEGNEDGSTYYFWTQGADSFARQISRAVRDHEAAISAWSKLSLLNLKYKDRD